MGELLSFEDEQVQTTTTTEEEAAEEEEEQEKYAHSASDEACSCEHVTSASTVYDGVFAPFEDRLQSVGGDKRYAAGRESAGGSHPAGGRLL